MESVTNVIPRDDFFLELWFNTGDHRLFDARPYLNRGVFIKLQDLTLFKQAFVALDTVCVAVCPRHSLKADSALNARGTTPVKFTSKAECIGCCLCALVCPDCCIEVRS